VRFTPGAYPIEALYQGLCEAFPHIRPNPLEANRVKSHFIEDIKTDPHALVTTCEAALADLPEAAETLLFVDQFEELFTLTKEADRTTFIALLEAAATSPKLRVIVTVRADFYHRCIESPALAALMENVTFPISAPSHAALYEMIVRPADRAGLAFEDHLAQRILDDTGDDPGSLALMAYTLDELYRVCKGIGQLTQVAYEALGRVQGAIGERSEAVFASLEAEAQVALPRVFRELVEVDERGTATRKRERLSKVAPDVSANELVSRFIAARLLVSSAGNDNEPYLEVAHEAPVRVD
jgi:hypothetical protein